MSWDIFVQDLPVAAMSVADIPDDFQPRPLGCSRARIIEVIVRVAPFADASDPTWIRVVGLGIDVEISLGSGESVEDFAFHAHGGELTAAFVATVLHELELRALDPQSESGIFTAKSGAKSIADWEVYRAQAGGR
jgi:hypothetical protein